MRKMCWVWLPLLALLNGCPKRQTVGPEPARDYESVRQNSEKAHQDLDRQQVPSEETK